MMHSDDKGLVLPPRLAPLQVVVVPIWKSDDEMERLRNRIGELTAEWESRFSFKIDDREQYRPGWKFNEWERRGVPLRVELGPRELERGEVVLVRRDTAEKITLKQEGLADQILRLLDQMQSDLYNRAKSFRDENTHDEDDYRAFEKRIENPGGFFWVHWCGDGGCEARFQETSKATIRLIPFESGGGEGRCIVCSKPSAGRVLVSKSY
jgi:prolyl-tRNA synthetase